MENIMYIGSFALIILTLAGVLSLVNINNVLTENSTSENNAQTIDPHDDVKILNDQMVNSDSDNYLISGQAQNTGHYKLRYVSITVNFYDKRGRLLYSSFDAKSYLNPNEIWSFEIPYRKSITPYSYSVKVGPALLK
ncbi:MAG TPA: FxLYD domain-containing protein [Methanobacterium sp.]|nr:FxLYD domain-containing protein [Methanobacterium sp.]